MKRRDFFRHGFIAGLGVGFVPALTSCAPEVKNPGNAKNIIFMVSDGMSTGTLVMADQLRYRKEGRGSNWLGLYSENKARRAMMDMASLNSIVTDSSAASSSWGGGHRVNNGAINTGPNGEIYTPILTKFKNAGKAVGCVTSVPITHATPSGFSVATEARADQPKIASLILEKRYDVMFGAGVEYFASEHRSDGRDMFAEFAADGFQVLRNKSDLASLNNDSPALGVFEMECLPYALDHANDAELQSRVPTLAELTDHALRKLSSHPNGFVVQIEGGKVDWAAHGNDIGALLYDQLAFDEAVGVALAFAEGRDDTLVVITTDHGNSNPALLAGSDANDKFDKIQHFTHTGEWILKELDGNSSIAAIRERVEAATKIAITMDEASYLKSALGGNFKTIYRPMSDAPEVLGQIMTNHTKTGFVGDNHTSDFVELTMIGPGSESMPTFMRNTDMHNFLLQTAGVTIEG